MQNQSVLTLIKKFLKGDISKQENKHLDEIWEKSLKDDSYLRSLSQNKREKLRKEMLHNIQSKIQDKQSHTRSEIVNDKDEKYKITQTGKHKRGIAVYRLAAAFIGMLFLAGIAYTIFLGQDTIIHSTKYGEQISHTLPDNSRIFLNGNSTIKYNQNFSGDGPREVWLEGEGYFEVAHTEDDRKFIVHTSDNFSVEVLGTSFNVVDRSSGTEVGLSSGKVKLKFQVKVPEKEAKKTYKSLIMEPGELFTLSQKQADYNIQTVRPEVFSAWKQGELVFDDTPISKIVRILEETYGYEVIINDETLLNQEVTGTVPSNSIDNLLFGISKTLDIQIEKNKNKILLSGKFNE